MEVEVKEEEEERGEEGLIVEQKKVRGSPGRSNIPFVRLEKTKRNLILQEAVSLSLWQRVTSDLKGAR